MLKNFKFADQWLNYLFYLLILVLLYPIITNNWFVSGDGPCHLYNAKVLKDILFGFESSFYEPFYKLNFTLAPNLFDHIILGILQLLFSPSISERIFLCMYVIMFSFGVRFLMNEIQPKSTWAAIPALIFVYHHLLLKGFFNFSFSIACSFWVIGYWIKHKDSLTLKHSLILCFLFIFNYFMHPIGFVLGVVGIVLLSFTSIMTEMLRKDANIILLNKMKAYLPSLGALLPAALFFYYYFSASDFSSSADIHWRELVKLESLMVYVEEEREWSYAAGKYCIILGIIGLLFRLFKGPLLHPGDGVLFLALFFVYSFIGNFINDGMMGGERLKFIPHLSILIWLPTIPFQKWMKILISLGGALFILIFSYYRYPAFERGSAWVDDYMECEQYIKPKSKLLTLNYDFNGTSSDGKTISTINWPFNHGTAYLGAIKPLILSDNYEAHMHWFPINWKDKSKSFYESVSVDGKSMEDRPPRVNFLHYAEKSGTSPIEYVLIIGRSAEHKMHEYSLEIDKQLSMYDLVCTSKSGRSELYVYDSTNIIRTE